MRVIYTEDHRLHRPPFAFSRGSKIEAAEVPERAEAILTACREAGFDVVAPRPCDEEDLHGVHTAEYVAYLRRAYAAWVAAGRARSGVIPGTFPVRPFGRLPADPARRAGHHCLDTETVITRTTYEAGLASAACALSGARALLEGQRAAYALCRPPGHHAGPDYCGGYCFLNNAAIAAERMVRDGACKVAVLDVDCHHGNGTQHIFYERDDVLYVSLHGDPETTFPYYWGRADEVGEGPGRGFNVNLPLPPRCEDRCYLAALATALDVILKFGPTFLVVSLGTDPLRTDHVGRLALSPAAFRRMGEYAAELGLPTLVVQEGGYDLARMGGCVVDFLQGLEEGPSPGSGT